MRWNILGEKNNFKFKTFEAKDVPFGDLSSFLGEHYSEDTDKTQVIYSSNYLKWFFSKGGELGVLVAGEEWVALFCVGIFFLRCGTSQGRVFNSGPLCVNKNYLFKDCAQEVVRQTSSYIKSKHKLPILGAGVTGVKKETLFKGFGMYVANNVRKPTTSCFSLNNLFLCDEGNFLKRFKSGEGFLLHHKQQVKHNNKKENWGIVVSYYTTGCWKKMIYEFSAKNGKSYDKVIIFENLERKGGELEDLGFKKFTSYNLYIDSPISLPKYFLYYNLFLF
jgi:hypothetical protein